MKNEIENIENAESSETPNADTESELAGSEAETNGPKEIEETIEAETDDESEDTDSVHLPKAHLRRIVAACLAVIILLLALIPLISVLRSLSKSFSNDSENDGSSSGNAHDPPTVSIVDTSSAKYSYEEMEGDLLKLSEKYPQLLRVASAGRSADGREIYYADLGSPEADHQIFISAGIHGREYLTPLLAMSLTEYYLSTYYEKDENSTSFAELCENYSFRIVPMVNPDGITLSQYGINGIKSSEVRQKVQDVYLSDRTLYESYRKYTSIDEYLKLWKANANGVDLNRNFDIDYWDQMKTGIPQPSAQGYKGAYPNSEAESAALISLLEDLSDPVCVISYHSRGEIIYWDCGQTGQVRTDTQELVNVAVSVTGYDTQLSFEHPDATFDDWCILEKGIPAITLETGAASAALPLDISHFETIWQQNIGLWKQLLLSKNTDKNTIK